MVLEMIPPFDITKLFNFFKSLDPQYVSSIEMKVSRYSDESNNHPVNHPNIFLNHTSSYYRFSNQDDNYGSFLKFLEDIIKEINEKKIVEEHYTQSLVSIDHITISLFKIPNDYNTFYHIKLNHGTAEFELKDLHGIAFVMPIYNSLKEIVDSRWIEFKKSIK